MRTICQLACTISILVPAVCFGSGWNDFELTIAPGYQIVRCNSFDIGLCDASGGGIYFPEQGKTAGPVTGYIVTPTHIFLKTCGQKPRNQFTGDRFVVSDHSVEYFFTVDRANEGALVGPLSLAAFSADPNVAKLPTLEWIEPSNPNSELAIIGMAVFLGITFLIFGLPLLAIVGLVLIVVFLFRARRPSKDLPVVEIGA